MNLWLYDTISLVEKRIVIVVSSEYNRIRLEDFLLGQFCLQSKMYLRELVKLGQCEVNGNCENIGYRLRPNDLVEIVIDESRGSSMRPDNIPLEIVFEDNDLIVVDKPAGMLAHPSHYESSGTLLNALAFHLNNNGKTIRPGLIHRLDKQTSGLMVVAKTPLAHRRLSAQFMKRSVTKRYVALVEGMVEHDKGSIIAPIGRFPELKQWGVREDGKNAESIYSVRQRYADTTLLEMEPLTGRTNQLRIHCQYIGHPIVGDKFRGGRDNDRLCLHASHLAFAHPITHELIEFSSELAF